MIQKFAIIGMPRSGTTFLASQISEYKGIYVMPELFWFHNYSAECFDDFINGIITHRLSQDKMLSYDVAEIYKLPYSGNVASDLTLLLDYIASRNNVKYIGVNTPSNYEYLADLLLVKFKVINVARTLREIADSYSRVNWTRHGYIVPLVRYRGYKKVISEFSDKLLTVRFETFESDGYLKTIFEFLGCHSEMEKHREIQRRIRKNVSWDDLHHERTREKFDRKDYETVLSIRQINLANYIEKNNGRFLEPELITRPVLIWTFIYYLSLYMLFRK